MIVPELPSGTIGAPVRHPDHPYLLRVLVYRSEDFVWRIEGRVVQGEPQFRVLRDGFPLAEQLASPKQIAEVLQQHDGPGFAELIED